MNTNDANYIAGLFDGEGSIYYVRRTEKKKKHRGKGHREAYCWRISMEITMTDQSVLRWVHECLGVGTVCKKPPGKGQMGRRMQWRWRCSSREAYKICCMMFPYSHVKLPKIQKIIDHYQGKVFDGKIVDLDSYRTAMALE